jgi:DNA-binding transcriptional MerR regulator
MEKNSELIGTLDAAGILGVNQRTVRRYAEKGLVKASLSQGAYSFDKGGIEQLKTAIDLKREYLEPIKELYALVRCGARLESVICQFDIHPKENIDSALHLYEFERDNYLNRFNLEQIIKDDALLAEEVASRLRITDKHVIYELMQDKEFKGYESSLAGKKRFFVSLDSFKRYLGDSAGERFYTSRDASRITRKTVNSIDRIAKSNNVGRKIKTGNKHSIYLFTIGEVHALKYLKRKK